MQAGHASGSAPPNPPPIPAHNDPQRERLITMAEVARRLSVDRTTVGRWVRAGQVPALRVGRVIRLSWTEVQRVAASTARRPPRE